MLKDLSLLEINAIIERHVKNAYREGIEAGYLLTLKEDAEKMTFTYFRNDKAEEYWKHSTAKIMLRP